MEPKNEATDISGYILFPGDGAYLPAAITVRLTAVVPTESIEWHSSLDGYLDSGSRIQTQLSTGEHLLSITDSSSIIDSVTIEAGTKTGEIAVVAAGMDGRGAMALLLYFLFTEEGGAVWPTESAEIVDTGGITFLHALLDGPETGWSNIEDATGSSTSRMLREWACWIAGDSRTESVIVDPRSGEPVSPARVRRLKSIWMVLRHSIGGR